MKGGNKFLDDHSVRTKNGNEKIFVSLYHYYKFTIRQIWT